jgi:hypothetical protein
MSVRNSIHYGAAFSICVFSLMLSCTMGGSAEQGNARISGALDGGSGAGPAIVVQLVAEGFNPFNASSGSVYSTKTDSAGKFEFEGVSFGQYYLYAFDEQLAYTLLEGPYIIAGRDELDPLNATLRKASVVTIIDSGSSDETPVYFFIKGASVAKAVRVDTLNLVKLFGVPPGILNVMKYDSSSKQASVYTRNLEILPEDSITISQHNRPPRILNASTQLPAIVYVDSVYSMVIHASDPDSNRVMYSILTPLQSYAIDRLSGAFTWTPKLSEIQLSTILIKTADADGAYSVFKWNVTVKEK